MAGPCNVHFLYLRVLPHFGSEAIGGFDIFWEVKVQNFAPTFTVEYADIEQGPWCLATPDPITSNFLKDATDKTLVFGNTRWFRVNVYNGTTLVLTSPPMNNQNSLNSRDYRYYRDILRRWRLQLEKFVGAEGFLLRRKIYGETCRRCTTEILKQPASSECTLCFGTGVVGGYYPAYRMFAQQEAGPAREAATLLKTAAGPSQITKRAFRLFPFPEAKTDDIWVDQGSGMRYVVEKSEVTNEDNYRGVPTRRLLTASLLPPRHPAYNFPIE